MKNRSGVVSHCLFTGYVRGRVETRGLVPDDALGFSHAPALPLRGLLVVSRSFHVADQAFLLAQLLETPDHLLNGLA